jgi:hypothetical protein
MKKSLVFDGSSVKSMDDFYDEVHRVFCPGFKGFGRNWHAFRDVLRGGFLVFEEGEEITVTISGSKKMRKHLPESQYNRIIKYFEEASNITLVVK